MMRLDNEDTHELTKKEEKAFLYEIENFISAVDPDIIIFEDYNKGILTDTVIRKTHRVMQKSRRPDHG